MGPVVRQGTEIALTRLLDLFGTDSPALDPRAQRFYRRIGTFESKQGRTLEAVLSAYRIGARVAGRTCPRQPWPARSTPRNW